MAKKNGIMNDILKPACKKQDIYIIVQQSGDPYEHWDNELGWVDSEDEAKRAVKELENSVPKCPVNDSELEDFDNALNRWFDEVQNQMEDELWELNPYQDDSEFRRPTDIKKYNEYMDQVEVQIKDARKKWFEENYPIWADKLDDYDKCQEARYDNYIYSYRKIEKFPS